MTQSSLILSSMNMLRFARNHRLSLGANVHKTSDARFTTPMLSPNPPDRNAFRFLQKSSIATSMLSFEYALQLRFPWHSIRKRLYAPSSPPPSASISAFLIGELAFVRNTLQRSCSFHDLLRSLLRREPSSS